MSMWQMIGLGIGGYVIVSVLRGEVAAKSGSGSKTFYKNINPRAFWGTIVLYTGLALVVFFVF
jgi:hypothetical protein